MAAFTNVRQVALQELAVLGSALLPIKIFAEAVFQTQFAFNWNGMMFAGKSVKCRASESPNDGRAGG